MQSHRVPHVIVSANNLKHTDEETELKYIVKRLIKGTIQYLVEWKGFVMS